MVAKTFDNAMTAHVWAQQTQSDGRSSNGNLWFAGRTIYSYGMHYPLATFAADGSLFINADSSTATTNSKHKPAVNRAVNYKGWRVPDLRYLMNALDSVGVDGLIPATHGGSRQTATDYLNTHWRTFPADSDAAAWLLRASGSRAKWANVRAKLESADNKLNATNARNAKRHAIAHAKEVAAIPFDMVRLRMIQMASESLTYNKERKLTEAVRFYMDAHRGSEPGKVRTALWDRVKLAKELSARFLKLSGKRNAERRGAIATLRRIWAGDYGANGALNIAYAERQNIDKALRGSTPPALRAKAIARAAVIDSEIARLEVEREAARMAEQAAERAEWLAGGRVANRYALKDERGGALVRAIDVEMDGYRGHPRNVARRNRSTPSCGPRFRFRPGCPGARRGVERRRHPDNPRRTFHGGLGRGHWRLHGGLSSHQLERNRTPREGTRTLGLP